MVSDDQIMKTQTCFLQEMVQKERIQPSTVDLVHLVPFCLSLMSGNGMTFVPLGISLEILFAAFRNGNRNKKYCFQHSGTGTRIRNTVLEQDQKLEMEVNFQNYWENDQEIFKPSQNP